MKANDLSDEELANDIIFARAVMETDSNIDDVWIEHEDGERITLRDLLKEAARRSALLFNQ